MRDMYPSALIQKVSNRLRRLKSVQQAITPFGKEIDPNRWIFIVGCYNSGTTLLNEILSTHDDISGLSCEGVVLNDVSTRPEEFGWTRMWSKCYEDVKLSPKKGMKKYARRIKKQWYFSYDSNPKNVLEKSIVHTASIPFFGEYFKPAYFIYIVRDGYAVAEGIRRKARPDYWNNPVYKDKYPIEICAEQWRETDKVFEKSIDESMNILKIKYENMSERTKKVMKKVTDFIGVKQIDKNVLDEKWKVHEYKNKIENMNSKSYDILSKNDTKKIEKVAGQTLKKYGYERPFVG